MRLVMMVLGATLAASAAQAAPLEAYSKLPSMRIPTISPDGSKIAFVQVVDGKEAVVIDQLSPAAAIANIPPANRIFETLTWVDSSHLIAYSVGASRAAQMVDLEQRKIRPLSEHSELRGVLESPMVRTRGGRTTLYVTGYTELNRYTYAPTFEAIDFATGKEERLARGGEDQSISWNIDPDGNLVSQSIYNEKSHVWTLQLRRGSDWVEVYSVKTLIEPPEIVGLTLDAKGLVLRSFTDDHGLEFRRVSLDEGKVGDLVPEYMGLNRLVHDPLTLRPIGGVKTTLEPSYVFFDPKDQALWDRIVKVFPREEVALISWTQDRSKAVVLVTGLEHGVSFHVVDTATSKAMDIGSAFKAITANDLSDIEVATYPAKDGLRIQALLTLPVGREPKNLPLIVLPHDGPADGDTVGYNAWAQALASRGYAVLQPQFRGSVGLDWKLQAAGFGQWGRKMQTDLSDGVRALAAKGYIDPKRVCIVGRGSYSGYAALAGVMFEQGVYRCSVAVDPWTDVGKLAGGVYADDKHSINVRDWERLVGAKDPRDPIFDQISPAEHADDASAPILIIHKASAAYDPVKLVSALNRAKKPVELVAVDDKSTDNKSIGDRSVDLKNSREAVLLQTMQAAVTFLEKNNPPLP